MTVFRNVRYLCILWVFSVSCSDSTSSTVKSLDAFSGGFSSASLRCSAQQVNVSNVEQHSYWTSDNASIAETNSGAAKPQPPVQNFPPQTGQMSRGVYPQVSSWSGYGGYGGCH